jgi:hypothetical protein
VTAADRSPRPSPSRVVALCAAAVFAALCSAGFAQLASRRPAPIASQAIASPPIALQP